MTQIDQSWYDRPDGLPESETAGGVVVRQDGDGIVIALAQEQIYDDFVLPKGHVEPGETIEAAARREIGEEIGVSDLTLIGKLGTKERMDFRKTEWKTTHYFLFTTRQRDATPTHVEQHDEMHWVPLEPVPSFFWPEQRDLVEENLDRIKAAFEN